MPAPLVSAIVTAYESERYIARAIESVLAQTHERIELVVVDNGSTDATVEIARGFDPDVIVRVEPNRGVCAARNHGLAASRGDYVEFLDADDIWRPAKTERQLAVLAGDPALDYALGWAQQFADPTADPESMAGLRIPEEPQRAQMICAMLAPRSSFDRVGPWPPLVHADGLHWFLRADELGMRGEMLPEVVYDRCIHGANMSRTRLDFRQEWAPMLKARIDQRRSEPA